ncbi:hypothetical protein pipiens_006597 [Culex pipiens pipiens]|uniref:Uncharacterized protein n=1 Tax=Culex pipiens pipiens TaxID=38569 RepID=A0ABD1DQH5_CULPP
MTATAIFPVHGAKPAPTLPETGRDKPVRGWLPRIKCSQAGSAHKSWARFGSRTLTLARPPCHYAGSCAVLGTSDWALQPEDEHLGNGVAGMLACLGHGYQWRVLFKENALRRAVEDEVRESVRNERVAGGVANVRRNR